jgi:glycosyltransferase involved in cell wall biosynthesis
LRARVSEMKVLSVHNSYQNAGGEDNVFAQEAALLRSRGNEVLLYHASNDQVRNQAPLIVLSNAIWNQRKFSEVASVLKKERPDLVHVHNTFSAISPAVYYAARKEGIPVVQTLHNYRTLCPAGTLFRDGQPCEDCCGKQFPWPAIVHACYKGSHLASAASSAVLTVHNYMHTWRDAVSAYIALTELSREKFIHAGFPGERIFVKPNFIENDPGIGCGEGGYALFVGRLTAEKGVGTLLEAWRAIGGKLPLQIAGDGPLAAEVEAASRRMSAVTWLKWLPRHEVLRRMKGASALIFPSTWHEPFGLCLVEAFAAGLPVIASNVGSMLTMIAHKRTGLHFSSGDARSLVEAVEWWISHPIEAAAMRKEARREYEKQYTPDKNYDDLMAIYEMTCHKSKARAVGQIPQNALVAAETA